MSEILAIKINKQGGPRINHGIVISKHKNLIAASIDLHSKRVEIDGYSISEDNCPIILIGKNADTLHLTPGKEDEWTEVEFPRLKGWDIFCDSVSRYTLNICFIKKV